eukprot:85905_1
MSTRKVLFWFLFVISLVIGGFMHTINDNELCDGTQYAEDIYSKLTNSPLINSEYSITSGYLVWFPNMTIWVANPNGIYAIYEIPPYPKYQTQYGIDLRSMDAFIFTGCTPPISHYFSWDSYLFYRYYNQKNVSWLFASLSDALNHLTINTTASTYSNSTFNALTTIITTGDKQTFIDINSVINSTQNDINLMSIPEAYFNFIPYGIQEYINPLSFPYDTFLPLIRIAIAENNKLYQQYTSYNQSVLFLQKLNVEKGVRKPRIPFEVNVKDTYSPNNINETKTYLNYLLEYMNDLIVNITTQYAKYGITFINYTYFDNNFAGLPTYGYSCIDNNMECVGDNRDAQYWNINITDLNDHIYIVIGVNSFNVNLSSSYQSFSYYNGGHPGQFSLTNFEYNSSLIDLNISNTNISNDILSKFFVIQYIRPNNDFIKNIPMIPIMETNLTWVLPNARDYLNIWTETRPDEKQMIPPILITFKIQ